MTDMGIKAFELARWLEGEGWNDFEEIALSFARGGVKKVVEDWWEDDCKEYRSLCMEIMMWFDQFCRD